MIDEHEVRDRIVAAADALYYARGIHEVGMDAVRAASGISLKRIYSVFPSKADLVVAVLGERRRVWDRDLGRSLASADGARGRLLAIFDFLRSWFETDDFRGCFFINTYGESGATSEAVHAVVRQQKVDFQALVERLALEAGGTEMLGRQLSLLAEGAQTSAAIAGDPSWADDGRAAAEALIDLAIGTVAAPASGSATTHA
jgi:AcrR family transcriptional regulator